MRLLFDQNLSFRLCRHLEDVFPGSAQVRMLGLGEASDLAIWRRAKADGSTLVSLDADFAEMAALLGTPPKVIWLRCGNQPTLAVSALLRTNADLIGTFSADPDAVCLEIY